MKKKIVYKIWVSIVFLFITQLGLAQNMVPNGDFENYSSIPISVGEWFKCNNWTNANIGTAASPDYLHILGEGLVQLPNSGIGTVDPFSGDAIMGFVTSFGVFPNYREYLSIQLSSPMRRGQLYKVSFALTNGKESIAGNSSNHIGMQFSLSPLTQATYEPIGGVPQIEIPGEVWSTTWQLFSFDFIADSTYNYITIGNFFDDFLTSTTVQFASESNAAYYFIDKVEIIPINKEDDYEITLEVPNTFTPNNDGFNDFFVPKISKGIVYMETIIYNRWGHEIFESDELLIQWGGQNISTGVYFWVIHYTDINGVNNKLTGYVTVLK